MTDPPTRRSADRDPTEPLDPGSPSANEPDEADGPFEAPADAFRSREQIEQARMDEGPADDAAERRDPTPRDAAEGGAG